MIQQQIRRPAPASNEGLRKGMGLGQVIAGAYTGNPAMATAGLGGLSGNSALQGSAQFMPTSMQNNPKQPASTPIGGNPANDGPNMSSLQRRKEQAQPSVETIKTLQLAEQAMPSLPQDVRMEIAPVLGRTMARTAQTIKNNPQYYEYLSQQMEG